jgi:hypothetical protein
MNGGKFCSHRKAEEVVEGNGAPVQQHLWSMKTGKTWAVEVTSPSL